MAKTVTDEEYLTAILHNVPPLTREQVEVVRRVFLGQCSDPAREPGGCDDVSPR